LLTIIPLLQLNFLDKNSIGVLLVNSINIKKNLLFQKKLNSPCNILIYFGYSKVKIGKMPERSRPPWH